MDAPSGIGMIFFEISLLPKILIQAIAKNIQSLQHLTITVNFFKAMHPMCEAPVSIKKLGSWNVFVEIL